MMAIRNQSYGAPIWILLSLWTSQAGCSNPTSDPGEPRPPSNVCASGYVEPEANGHCPPGTVAHDVCCQPAGLPLDMSCAPGEWPREDGTCKLAGVPPDLCADGFLPDERRGCAPILPSEHCPTGTMAVPGETVCREVVPCGEGKWGAIPIEKNTQFVDQSYDGSNGPSTGTMERPWLSIHDGIKAAETGAIVAVAEGQYQRAVLWMHSVRLWGVCPARVTIEDPALAAVQVYATAGAEIHNVTVGGGGQGVVLDAVQNVVLENVLIHGTEGIFIEGSMGVSIRSSLVEEAQKSGIALLGSEVEIRDSVVRNTQPDSSNEAGCGINTWYDPVSNEPSVLHLDHSVIEGNSEHGIFILGSDATVERTVVRDSLPTASGFGRGIGAQPNSVTFRSSSLNLRGSVVEHNHQGGVIIIGSEAVIRTTVVRDTLMEIGDSEGIGVGVQYDAQTHLRSKADVRDVLLENNRGVGLAVLSSTLEPLEGALIRGTLSSEGNFGRAIEVNRAVAAEPSQILMRGCLLEQNEEAGVVVTGSSATITAMMLRDGRASSERVSRGVIARPAGEAPSELTLRRSQLEQIALFGIVAIGSTANLEEIVIHDVAMGREGSVAGRGGWGIVVSSQLPMGSPSAATLKSVSIDHSHEIGVLVLDSNISIDDSSINATQSNGEQRYGDGIAVLHSASEITQTRVVGTRIMESGRAGISSFGGDVTLGALLIECAPIDLNGEMNAGVNFSFVQLQDREQNRCGCPTATAECKVRSSGLEPPTAIDF